MTLKYGDKGDKVRYLQERLAAKGFLPGRIDGDFGDGTLRAVRQFQAANGLKVDGVVGDRTWAMLQAGPAVPLPGPILASDKAALQAKVAAVPAPRKAVLLAAIDTLGWAEQPDGANNGPDVGKISSGYYPTTEEAKGNFPPWCALAVSYWLKVGLNAPTYATIPFGDRFGAVSQIEDWGKANSRFDRSLVATTAAPGAIFTMDRTASGSDPSAAIGSGHTGLVIEDLGDALFTIEGNTSNAVATRTRKKSTLRGWVRWW